MAVNALKEHHLAPGREAGFGICMMSVVDGQHVQRPESVHCAHNQWRRRADACPGERARDFPHGLPLAASRGPVYLLGTGESVETPMVSQMEDFTSSRALRVAGPAAFAEAASRTMTSTIR
jgi:hypothetical protein